MALQLTAYSRLPDRGEAQRSPDSKEHPAYRPAYQGHSGGWEAATASAVLGLATVVGTQYKETGKQGRKSLIPMARSFPGFLRLHSCIC